ncbi:hypothetical protein Cgig2_013425 [Carnegiea gigantea]|uniref:DUF4283 domain-containing protein n=1 Tax=Carnegiea gigantea TaxID=171969 RepID=A0A9Q1JUY0_9CARY|nr:hypothetical protein Cgig2_013425 [Carnegiea gigantea]
MARGGKRLGPRIIVSSTPRSNNQASKLTEHDSDNNGLAKNLVINETITETEGEDTRGQNQLEIIHPQPDLARVSTFTSLLDPDGGMRLDFVQATEIEGMKYAKITKQDVDSEIEYWATVGFIRRMWKIHTITKIAMVRKGLFIVRFDNERDKLQVTQRGIYFFDNKLMVVKPWNEAMKLNVQNIQSLPLWVQFPELDIKYWGCDSLSKLGSHIGILIKTDKYTKDKEFLHYVKKMNEVLMEGSFLNTIELINDYGVLVKLKVNRVLRSELWAGMENIANNMDEAWGIIGGFNSILYPNERIGGDEMEDIEIRDFTSCPQKCELHEMRSIGAFYSWINRTIWSRLDRMVVNDLWYVICEYGHLEYVIESLSDHTPLVLTFLDYPKTKAQFRFCDMWAEDESYDALLEEQC